MNIREIVITIIELTYIMLSGPEPLQGSHHLVSDNNDIFGYNVGMFAIRVACGLLIL